LLLLAPYLPLLFMGQEYGEANPFPFFCSFFDPQLVQRVREGRKQEFDNFAWQGEVPDPQAEATFKSARLSWSWPEGTPRAGLRRLYRDLLIARREWPALRNYTRRSARLLEDGETGPLLELVRGTEPPGQVIRAVFNLGDRSRRPPGGAPATSSTLFTSEAARYGGSRRAVGPMAELLPFECLVFGPPSWRTFS
jgi:maltooligosyltrehalose trehalohydrolase